MKGKIVVGRYRLERVLGEGGMGRVYLARDTKERGLVWAVKEIEYGDLSFSEGQQARVIFKKEAEMLLTLSHPSLPKVVGYYQEGTFDYLVMERVEGPTLESMLEGSDEPLGDTYIAAVGWNLANTLNYLHTRSPAIVYRDLKPANVMVALDGSIKLIDFGIARATNPTRAGDTTAYGTPGYAAPEQYMGQSTPASDIYSLGMTLMRMASLYEPPEIQFTHPRARDLNQKLAPELDELIASMLDKDWTKRPPAERVKLRLDNFIRFGNKGSQARIWLYEVGRLKKWLGQILGLG